MNTYSNTPPKPGLIEENAARFENDLTKADSVRANGMTGLLGLRAQKVKYRLREVEVIAARKGNDDPEVIELRAAVAADQRFVLQLGAEAARAATATPGTDPRAWTVYGFVRDPNLQGQAGLTVALFDRTNRWIDVIGHACTDNRGYFQLRYAPAGEPAAERFREVFIHVSNAKQEVLYRDKKPMKAAVGGVQYREIILGDDCATCQPPADAPSPRPPGLRKSSKASKPSKARSTKKVRKDKKA